MSGHTPTILADYIASLAIADSGSVRDSPSPADEWDTSPQFADPYGQPINQAAWLLLFADPRIRWTLRTPIGVQREVVTLWFGVTHHVGDPLFETTLHCTSDSVDKSGGRRVVVLATHRTLAEAKAGHAQWVEAARRGPLPAEVDAAPCALAHA